MKRFITMIAMMIMLGSMAMAENFFTETGYDNIRKSGYDVSVSNGNAHITDGASTVRVLSFDSYKTTINIYYETINTLTNRGFIITEQGFGVVDMLDSTGEMMVVLMVNDNELLTVMTPIGEQEDGSFMDKVISEMNN